MRTIEQIEKGIQTVYQSYYTSELGLIRGNHPEGTDFIRETFKEMKKVIPSEVKVVPLFPDHQKIQENHEELFDLYNDFITLNLLKFGENGTIEVSSSTERLARAFEVCVELTAVQL